MGWSLLNRTKLFKTPPYAKLSCHAVDLTYVIQLSSLAKCVMKEPLLKKLRLLSGL